MRIFNDTGKNQEPPYSGRMKVGLCRVTFLGKYLFHEIYHAKYYLKGNFSLFFYDERKHFFTI